MDTPPPPPGFRTWHEHINYRVQSEHPAMPLAASIHPEVSEELREYCRLRVLQSDIERHMKWLHFLDEWWPELSRRLERSFEDVLYNRILIADYPSESVRIQFSDGSEIVFRNAFCLGAPPPDHGRDDLHVFSKHCGYHRFAVNADDRIQIERQH